MGIHRKILVTGGAGYIGSHAVLALLEAGYQPLVLDNLSSGTRVAVPGDVVFYEGDVGDEPFVHRIMELEKPTGIMHFAGSIVVPESIKNPSLYYSNNTFSSLKLAMAAIEFGVEHFIFSSTAAIYGQPQSNPVKESERADPISPYGWSKYMTEQILRDLSVAYKSFRPVALRYFNVAGADLQGRAGQYGRQATHLIKSALDVYFGRRSQLEIFGTDYPTRDGTCERDFVHVSDLATAHIAALRYLEAGGAPDVFNCGYGRGVTVREVVSTLERVTGTRGWAKSGPRRLGDAAAVIADVSHINSKLNWTPRFSDLEEILQSAIQWERKHS